jgi:Chaperone of endosialidase
MRNPVNNKTKTKHEPGKGKTHLMNSMIQLKRLVPLVLVSLALLPLMYAQDSSRLRANSHRVRTHVGSRERPVAPAPRPHTQTTDRSDSPLVGPPPPDGVYGGSTAEGYQALHTLPNMNGDAFDTGIGWRSLYFDTGTFNFNTGVGAGTLALNNLGGTGAVENTATGAGALLLNTSGLENTANGAFALIWNSAARDNTAVGDRALEHNDQSNTGLASFNNAVGSHALHTNVDGFSNNALGESALFFNQTGALNTAVGDLALQDNDNSGSGAANFNTGVGGEALFANVDGDSNNAIGYQALTFNTIGVQNNAQGFQALMSNDDGASNVAIGDSALSGNAHGSFNTVVGWEAGFTLEGDDNIYIGATSGDGVTSESGTIRIGDPMFVASAYVAGIFGQTATGGVPVFVDANGKLGTVTSSARFKDDIKPMDKASESILALKPVTFRYKKQMDANRIPQFGLVAEDVAQVNPELVVNGRDGKPYTVRYEAVNAMLLNEFLKEHKKVEKQEATIAQLKNDFQTVSTQQRKEIQLLSAQLKEQASQIQKVSAQLEASKPAPQVVNNP